MKNLYIRWVGILLGGIIIVLLSMWRYYQEVMTIPPEQLLREQPARTVRVQGTVKAGSLMKGKTGGVTFHLIGEKEGIEVRYAGEAPDNVRELSSLVVVGSWDPSTREFTAHQISLRPNYGFVVAAYVISFVPLSLFLFRMERSVALLYNEVKQETVYKEEWQGE